MNRFFLAARVTYEVMLGVLKCPILMGALAICPIDNEVIDNFPTTPEQSTWLPVRFFSVTKSQSRARFFLEIFFCGQSIGKPTIIAQITKKDHL